MRETHFSSILDPAIDMCRNCLAALGLAVLLSCLTLGCGGGPVSETLPTAAEPPALKQVLEGIAQTGEVGSAGAEVRTRIEDLRKSDSAKADAMSRELTELEKMNEPAQIKAKASSMAARL